MANQFQRSVVNILLYIYEYSNAWDEFRNIRVKIAIIHFARVIVRTLPMLKQCLTNNYSPITRNCTPDNNHHNHVIMKTTAADTTKPPATIPTHIHYPIRPTPKTSPPPYRTLAELTIDDIGNGFGPSSPLSTSTLSGSGGTVIQVAVADATSAMLPQLSASRTSTPLKVVQSAVQQAKHGFHVAAAVAASVLPGPRFTGGDLGDHHHDDRQPPGNGHDTNDDYMECSPAGTDTHTHPFTCHLSSMSNTHIHHVRQQHTHATSKIVLDVCLAVVGDLIGNSSYSNTHIDIDMYINVFALLSYYNFGIIFVFIPLPSLTQYFVYISYIMLHVLFVGVYRVCTCV